MAYLLNTIIALSLATLIIIGVFVFILYRQFNKLRQIPKLKKETRVINFLKEFAHGHATGWLLEVRKVCGRDVVYFVPDDLTEEELETSRKEDRIIVEKVATESFYIVPKGKASRGCAIAYIFPNDSKTMLEQLPDSAFKDGASIKERFTKGLIMENLMLKLGDSVKAGNEGLASVIKKMRGGELSREVLIGLEEFAETILKEKKKDDLDNK